MTRYVSVLLVALWGGGVACTPGAPPPAPPIEEPAKPRPPGAPGAVSARAEVGGATLTWSAPADNGGSALTGYQVTGYRVEDEPREGPLSATVEGTTARVSGLSAGATYRFRVRAVNEAGMGSPSPPSEAVTLPDVPGAPRDVSVARGDRQVEVTWSAPVSDGGRPVLGYVITASPQGTQVRVEATARSAVVGGLTNGVASSWSVRALNAVGEGLDAGPASVEPGTVPAAPVGVDVTAGVRQVTVTWSEPADTGGLPVSSYAVTVEPGGRTVITGSSARSVTVVGLSNATEYTGRVVARNAVGEGPPASGPSRRTPDVPRAPGAVMAVRDVRAVKVSWEAPAEDGGSALTGYAVEVQPTGRRVNVDAGAREVTVTALPSTQAYTVAVHALNAAGQSGGTLAPRPVRPLPTPARLASLSVNSSSSGCSGISYVLEQDDFERADVRLEVDVQGNGTFRPATQAGSTDHGGTLARPVGMNHFLWNRTRDVAGAASVQVRVSARVPGTAPRSRTLTVDLPAGVQRCEVSLDTGRVSLLPGPVFSATPGDFDRDGKPDLMVVLENGGQLALLKGLGNGAFQAHTTLEGLGFSSSHRTPPVAADLNGDGALDLLWTDRMHDTLLVLLGHGDGSFAPVRRYDTGLGSWNGMPGGLAVEDFDGDGALDVALIGTDGRPGLFWNQGNGTLRTFQPLEGTGIYGGTLAAADLDEDGHPDLVVSGPFTSVLLRSNANRTFRAQSLEGLSGMHELRLADFDADGHVDLISGRNTSGAIQFSFSKGDGQGGFAGRVEVATIPGHTRFPEQASVSAADLDGDGRLDLAVVNESASALHLLRGRGDGTFAAGARLPPGQLPFFVFTADLDADGVSDVATLQQGSDTVRVWPGRPGRTEEPLRTTLGGVLASGDLNGDGWKDVVAALEGPARVVVSLGGPQGLSAPLAPIAVRDNVLGLQVARVDADGMLDVVVRYAISGDSVGLLLGNGDGTLRPAAEISVGATAVDADHGDVNGDGKLDLVFATYRVENGFSREEVRLLLGQGDGTFGPPRIPHTGGDLGQVLLGDVTGDGRQDLLVVLVGHGQSARILPGRGDGSFTTGPALGLGADFFINQLGLADLDLDGRLDVLVSGAALYMKPSLHVMKGLGQGEFTRLGAYPIGGNCHRMVLADVNADGGRDVLCANADEDSVTLLRGVNQGVFQPAQGFGTYVHGAVEFVVLDANGDGLLDVISGSRFGPTALLLQH